MKNVKKTETAAFIVFAANVVISIWLLVAFFVTLDKMALLTSVLGVAASVVGFLSVYRKDSSLSIVSGVLILAEITVLFFNEGVSALGFLELAVFGYFAVRNFLNIKKYRWLEQQDGFPNFEPKLKEYDANKAQRDTKDPYALKMEERQKSSAGSMAEL